jgi:hypothetical protein
MKNNYTIIGYYTPEYKKVAETNILQSLKKFPNLVHHFIEIKNRGTWYHNTNYKPIFIKDCLDLFTDDLAIIDVDATINSYPYLFDNLPKKYDISFHYLQWKLQYGNINKRELLTGTMYLRNNKKIHDLVNKWVDNLDYTGRTEQKVLEKIIEQESNLSVFELPREYCYIESIPDGKPFTIVENPIISHYQYSREFKKKLLK